MNWYHPVLSCPVKQQILRISPWTRLSRKLTLRIRQQYRINQSLITAVIIVTAAAAAAAAIAAAVAVVVVVAAAATTILIHLPMLVNPVNYRLHQNPPKQQLLRTRLNR